MVMNNLEILWWDGKLNSLTEIQKKEIKHKFQNRIIIIDEIHNIKSDSSNIDLRKVPPILQAIIKYADNIRLVMMSATPMYDNASEIIFILNLLLENDGKQTIKKSDIFDSDDVLIPGAQEKLYKLFKGYVSYVRGDNPLTFPLKIIPNNCVTPVLNYDIKGNLIKQNEKMKSLKLFMCEMGEYQYKQYKLKLNSTTTKILIIIIIIIIIT